MITIQLDEAKQQRFEQLATSAGQDVSELVQRIVDEYLDAQAWCQDSAEDWAAASVALAPDILASEMSKEQSVARRRV